MGARRHFTDDQIITALQRSSGIQNAAAKLLESTHGRKCSRQQISERVLGSAKISAALAEIVEENLDIAEGQLIEAVKDREAWAVIWTLRTLGKKRGYTERTELTGPGGTPLQLQVSKAIPDFQAMDDNALDAYLADESAAT